MKARDLGLGLTFLAGCWLVCGCNMVDKKKYDEADARALQATTRLNDTTAALDKAKADCAKLEAAVKQKDSQIASLKAENKQAVDAAKAEAKRMSDELKAVRDRADNLARQLEQANAKAKDADQLSATVQKLEQENKKLQTTVDRFKTQTAAKGEPNAPTTGAAPR
jgi:chromosome segregation ATPase